MKFIVSVKQVPSRDSALKIDTNGTWLDETDLTYEMNEPDAYALEEALQLKEKLGGDVLSCALGPAERDTDDSGGARQGRRSGDPCPDRAAPLDPLTTGQGCWRRRSGRKHRISSLPVCNRTISGTGKPAWCWLSSSVFTRHDRHGSGAAGRDRFE